MTDTQRYYPISIRYATKDKVEEYFATLLATKFARMRFQFWEPVDMRAIETYIYDPYNMVYMIADQEKETFCGEITFNNFCHKSAFVHFSIHPEYIKPALKEEYRKLMDFFLTQPDGVRSFIAWIPENNTAAKVFAQNLGFEYQCIIPNSAYIARDKLTIGCNQLILVKEN